MTKRRSSFTALFCTIAAIISCAPCLAQQASVDLVKLTPQNALLVAGCDCRPSNASMQALDKARDPKARELQAQQQIAMRKAVESFATLFGISLDFAKDIESWNDQQWQFVVIPEAKEFVPVLMVGSTNPSAAMEALQKLLEPWQRIGQMTPEPDQQCPIIAYKTAHIGATFYACASGSIFAFSPSKECLKQALSGTGFAAGSVGDKVLNSLSGSMFYAYADPSLLKLIDRHSGQLPIDGIGIGVSIIDTGARLRVIGYPNEQSAAFLKQVLANQPKGALTVNAGIPSTTLITASFPDLFGFAGLTQMFGAKNPAMDAIMALGETQVSAAMTAALPIPAGVVCATTASEQAATEKLAKVAASLKQLNVEVKPNETVAGVQMAPVMVSHGLTMYLGQIGQHILLASDTQSLSAAAKALKGEQPGIAQTDVYKETMAALGDSNLATAYVNLAPVQGLGYLVDGLGIAQLDPMYAGIAKCAENMQAFGLGLGFDGQAASATMFFRAKPDCGPAIGPAVFSAGAICAAVLFPVFQRAQVAARTSTCMNNAKELSIATICYSDDNNGKLPSATKWREQLKHYIKSPDILACPDSDTIFAFNKNLSGVNANLIQNPSEVILFFQASPNLSNASGSRQDTVMSENGCIIIAYADSHVRKLNYIPEQSQWVPKMIKPAAVKKAPAKRVPVRRHK